jgi:hypothetical protein
MMNGLLNDFAVLTNSKDSQAINSFYRHVGWYWCRALRRRGQISRLSWQRMKRLTGRQVGGGSGAAVPGTATAEPSPVG